MVQKEQESDIPILCLTQVAVSQTNRKGVFVRSPKYSELVLSDEKNSMEKYGGITADGLQDRW